MLRSLALDALKKDRREERISLRGTEDFEEKLRLLTSYTHCVIVLKTISVKHPRKALKTGI
jgi:hypothetical protein